VLGTGSQGVLRRGGGFSAIGGWGFMVSDAGSGAALGHAAVRRSLGAQDGIGDASDFTREVMARWEHDPVRLLAWSAAAGPRDWATLAPVVFDWEARGDVVAREVLRAAIGDVEAMIDRLGQLGAARIALMGGLADRYRPHLAERLAGLLVAPMGDALEGALHLAGLGQDGHQPGAPKLR
jgi:glucosamine kinase